MAAPDRALPPVPPPQRRYRSLVAHWLGAALRGPRPTARPPLPVVAPGQLALTFGGHATSLLRYADASIVVDPMLGGWLGPVRRAEAPGLGLDDLAAVDLVLVTHLGPGHLHLPTLAHLPRAATIIGPRGAAAKVSRLGFARVIELAPGADVGLRGARIDAVAMPGGGLAYVVRGDGPSALACGDGGYDGGLAEVGRRHAPDVALLPIGGYWPGSFRDRHMAPSDALAAFEDLRARLLVPVRHGAFALSYEHLAEPARWLAELTEARGLGAHVCPLRAGESEVLTLPRGARGAHADGAGPGAAPPDVLGALAALAARPLWPAPIAR